MDSVDPSTSHQQPYLANALKPWRCILTQIHPILMWEKPLSPHILFGLITALFGIIHFMHASVLTGLSLVGIFACVLDYLMPIISEKYLEPQLWREKDEQTYSKLIVQLLALRDSIKNGFDLALEARRFRPKAFYVTVISFLMAFAWVANLFNNLLLTYMIVLAVTMLPGAYTNGYLDRAKQRVLKMGGNSSPKSTKKQ
ncbi:ADP-ribosylation factor-like 6 interacting protein 1 [Brevipalpus obovatus]|uniref:ADP-ribosylation factor-like 6 interacting protein 1 n=1 Tax=Brevipalpus obovatus TaxID=246614 RepID=UPI003D9E304B